MLVYYKSLVPGPWLIWPRACFSALTCVLAVSVLTPSWPSPYWDIPGSFCRFITNWYCRVSHFSCRISSYEVVSLSGKDYGAPSSTIHINIYYKWTLGSSISLSVCLPHTSLLSGEKRKHGGKAAYWNITLYNQVSSEKWKLYKIVLGSIKLFMHVFAKP